MGYRYKCKSCANHDICETCFKAWDGGKGTVANHLNQQKLSTNAADHTFAVHKDKGFKRGPGAGPTSNRARKRGTASEGERALSLGRSSRAPAPRPRRPRRSPTTPVRATRARPPASRRRTSGGSDPREEEEEEEERGSGRRGARARAVSLASTLPTSQAKSTRSAAVSVRSSPKSARAAARRLKHLVDRAPPRRGGAGHGSRSLAPGRAAHRGLRRPPRPPQHELASGAASRRRGARRAARPRPRGPHLAPPRAGSRFG